ncbi:19844_t:CDS:2, partial [Gigaspora margarita]
MKKLKELDISNTDINEVDINKLPNSLKNIECSTKSRLTCKLTAIVSQLEKQPNTGKNLCQLCVEKELAQLNGQELIENYGLNKYKEVTKDVVLKSLNNSQNITWEFLTEIANTKLVDSGSSSVSDVVKCYGISQDPITKNYVMVMKYMAEGNLRQYLQQKGKEMDLEKKLFALQGIALGLGKIHNQSLVHCDFHSGNILGRKITDLGL